MIRKIKKIMTNPYFFSIFTEFSGVIVAFLFTVFQSRFLGPEIKGQVATVNSIVSITSIIFGFGIYQAYPYYKKKNQENIISIFMKLALILLIIEYLISVLGIILFDLSVKYIAVLIITPMMVYYLIISEITLVEEPNTRNGIYLLVSIVELIVVLVCWLVAEPTFVLGVIIITIKHFIKAVFLTIKWRKYIFAPCGTLSIWIPRMIKYGTFPMLSVLMSTLNYRVDVLMLNGQVADAAIGIYSVGVLLADRIWLVPDAMKGVMTSKLTKGKGDGEVAFVVRMCNTICAVIVVGIILVGSPFINFVFGPEYKGAYSITLILLIGVFPMISYKSITAYNIVAGKQKASFWMLSVGVLSNIVANYFLIPLYGIYGAGIASVISYIISAFLFLVHFCKNTGISVKDMLFVNSEDRRLIKSKLKKKN